MSKFNALTSMVSAESSGQRRNCTTDLNINVLQPDSTQQTHASSDGPVAILWDMENCPVPSDVRPEDVAGNIRMALRVHPIIKGAVMLFSAYGDFNAFPRRLREGCQRTGVKLVDVPNGRKDAADKAILVDMFLFALDNPPPSTIMLISGDVDFAPALHILGQRGYTVILVIPSRVDVSSALRNAGKFVWDWPSVSRGEGFVPAVKALMPPRAGSADISGYFMGCQISHNPDYPNEEEAIVYRGVSQSYYNSRDLSVVSQSLSGQTSSHFPSTSRSQSVPCANEHFPNPSSYERQLSDTMWVQPGDINGLKGQLVKLLELSGGCLPLIRVPSEYQKLFGRNLYVSEYGECKLVNLFKNMDDAVAVDGKGNRKFVYLKNWKASPSAAPPFVLLRRDNNKAKRDHEESVDVRAGKGVSSDDLSEEERVVVEENEKRNRAKSDTVVARISNIGENHLELFKNQLQEILVSYSCRIFLDSFEAVYQQRYKKPLEYRKFGVDKLEELLNKMADIVVLHEDPASKRKFITAVGM